MKTKITVALAAFAVAAIALIPGIAQAFQSTQQAATAGVSAAVGGGYGVECDAGAISGC